MKTPLWVGAALLIGGTISGCSSTGSHTQAAPARDVAVAAAPPSPVILAAVKPPQKPDPLQNEAAVGQGIQVAVPDLKHPPQMLWKAWIRSGTLADNVASGQDISILLFDAGRLDAKVTAPQGVGNTQTNDIVAFGGARYTSLVPEKRGTYLTAQKVNWNAKTKLGIARGNVHYHDGKSGATMDTPILYFNSGLRLAGNRPLGRGQ